MSIYKKLRYRTVIIATIFVLLVVGGLIYSPDASSHTPKNQTCYVLQNSAPTGRKYRTKILCFEFIREHYLAHECAKPRPIVRGITVKGRRADLEQRTVITTILNMGRKRGASRKVQLASIAGVTQESGARELPYGHGTSVGPLQLINTHGPARLRKTIEFSGDWFLDRALNIDYHRPNLSVTELTQAVQGSAHPNAYAQWVPEARRTYKKFLGPCRR